MLQEGPEDAKESASCALCNWATSPISQDAIAAAGAIPVLLQALDCSPDPGVQENSLWALSNLTSESANHRAAVAAGGGFQRMQAVLDKTNIPSQLPGRAQAVLARVIAGQNHQCVLMGQEGVILEHKELRNPAGGHRATAA